MYLRRVYAAASSTNQTPLFGVGSGRQTNTCIGKTKGTLQRYCLYQLLHNFVQPMHWQFN